ncbi:MAG: hypothetical protein CVT49_02780 [candidate division Zixibacteria bacterium HGW-Zixibacteria-1]|nr:MAG: hypothetical protein CVT49_02780 [candidate division Zixibacteria bacterium HGW-Zixibacteria-1]
MNIPSFNFSLQDFLAYFVPGTLALLAIVIILLPTPLFDIISNLNPGIGTLLIAAILAYLLGVVLSSCTFNYERNIYEKKGEQDPRECFIFEKENYETNENFKAAVLSAFYKLMPLPDQASVNIGKNSNREWSTLHFYMSRSIVMRMAPECAAAAERQNSLRQLRRNCLWPFRILGFAGTYWGILLILFSWDYSRWIYYIFPVDRDLSGFPIHGALLAISAVILIRLLIKLHIRKGMIRNRRREAREIYTGLILLAQSYNRDNDKSATAGDRNISINKEANDTGLTSDNDNV